MGGGRGGVVIMYRYLEWEVTNDTDFPLPNMSVGHPRMRLNYWSKMKQTYISRSTTQLAITPYKNNSLKKLTDGKVLLCWAMTSIEYIYSPETNISLQI